MLRIAVVTLFPELVQSVASCGITGRAVKNALMSLDTVNPRDYATDVHRTVDDRPYGGGPGMVMKVEPLRSAIRDARAKIGGTGKTIYLSPQGRKLTQSALRDFAASDGLVLVAGRYEGIDERVVQLEVTEEWSIGDYVLSGGELPAMVMIDGMARLLPGALGHDESAVQDSFTDGLLDCPHYTRPEVVEGLTVPSVLIEGHHEKIKRWRRMQALGRTAERRPDLLVDRNLDAEAILLIEEYQRDC